MQIKKDGSVIYDSIDNSGNSDYASLGAQYAKGRLDTLEGRFSGYYTKAEVLDLLTGVADTLIVSALPAEPVANTYYLVGNDTDGYILHYYDTELSHAIVGSYDLDLSSINPQRETLPTASADLAGKVYQYTGTTQARYTRGKWYLCANQAFYGWLNTSSAVTLFTYTENPTAGDYIYNADGVLYDYTVASVDGNTMTDSNGGTWTRNSAGDKTQYQWTDLAEGAISGVWNQNLTPGKVLVSGVTGKIGASTVTADELNSLTGITANVQTQLDGKAPLAGDYELITTSDPLQVDNCKFNFHRQQGTFTRITERRLFNAYCPDNIGGGNIWGIVEVVQMVRSNGVCYIEQTFTRFQGDTASANETKYTYKLYRKGYATGITDPFTQVASATVTWNSWMPISYPKTEIYNYNGAYINAAVRGGMCYLDLSGNFTPRYTSGNQHILGYVTPTPLRPALEVHGTIQTKYGQPDGEIETFWIQVNGEVKGFTMTEWTNIRGSICYPVGY